MYTITALELVPTLDVLLCTHVPQISLKISPDLYKFIKSIEKAVETNKKVIESTQQTNNDDSILHIHGEEARVNTSDGSKRKEFLKYSILNQLSIDKIETQISSQPAPGFIRTIVEQSNITFSIDNSYDYNLRKEELRQADADEVIECSIIISVIFSLVLTLFFF